MQKFHIERKQMKNIAALLQEKSQISERFFKFLYGSVEIRKRSGKKYLYIHLPR